MAKNDYPVIVYQILSYLYKCLKSGDDVQGILLNYDSPMFDKLERPAENGASFIKNNGR